MCGIVGAVWNDGPPLELETLRAMAERLRHRGPDDDGYHWRPRQYDLAHYVTPGVALGFRRLSIIDLAGGAQPISNEDQTIWLVFNGEVYNYKDLQHRLQGSGHKLRTQSDSEVLVHLYEDEGPDFVRHVNGMFSLAIWDERKGQLVLARDRLGKKPLVYRPEAGRLLFASELKALLAVPGAVKELDPNSLDEYLLYQYVPHPRSILKGYYKLPPGHVAVYCRGQLQVRPYWQPDLNDEAAWPLAEYQSQLRQKLTQAVEYRLQSDVPLGAFLSGGVDSSIIVALMQSLRSEPVRTFSIGFDDAAYDETSYASLVARHLGTEHREFKIRGNCGEILPTLAFHYDEPFGDSSAIPTYYVSQETRRHVTVALSGDGGDELFAGYPRHRATRLAHWFTQLPDTLKGLLAGRWWNWIPGGSWQKSPIRRFKRLMEGLNGGPRGDYLAWISVFDFQRRANLYTDDFVRQLQDSEPDAFVNRMWGRMPDRDPVTQVSLADLHTYLPCDLMTKVDIASMANSLECRCPFLDYRVVELAIKMPVKCKMPFLKGKKILLSTFGKMLPRAISRRGKMGFGVPLRNWLRGPLASLMQDLLLSQRSLERGYFRPGALRELVDQHRRGQFDHGYRIWSLMMLELWHRTWLDAPAPEAATPAIVHASRRE